MNRSKRVAAFVVGVLLVWAGLGQSGSQAPTAGARAVGQARNAPPVGAVDLRCRVEQPLMILSVVPPGASVKTGDLLVELDASALIDKRIQQVLDVKKAETETILATEAQDREKRAAAGQVALAEKALRLAQAQLKAYAEGEYVHQLALTEGGVKIAKEKCTIAEERVLRLQAAVKSGETPATLTGLQEAQMALQEAKLRLAEAEGALSLLKGFVHDNKVEELELAIAQREFDLARAQDAVSAAATRGAATVALAEMTRGMEADRLARLDDQIVKCKIYAPQDGTVVYPDETKPGAVVRERQILVRLLPVTPPKP